MPCRLILLRCSQNIYEKNSGRPDTTKFRTKLEIFGLKENRFTLNPEKYPIIVKLVLKSLSISVH